VGAKRFDRKFGIELLKGLPESPGVYLWKDASGEVLYAGKAKNLRRRLASYRNPGRRKAHAKMRAIVRDAQDLEVLPQPTEADALLFENRLIRSLRPRYNVEGAFAFLYPAIGAGWDAGRLILCFTTQRDAYRALGLRWHGVFRPRWRARDTFSSLVELLALLGHLEPRSRLPAAPRLRGSRLVAVRRAPVELLGHVCGFFDGESNALLGRLCTLLLERREARREAPAVQAALASLESFYRDDARALREARLTAGRKRRFVPQHERDSLFIRAKRSRNLGDGRQSVPD
jgi:excinuclease ABC subunit C